VTLVKWKLISVYLEIVLNSTQDRCTVAPNVQYAQISFWAHLMELLGCVWFGSQMKWVGSIPLLWVGINPSLVWLQGWVQPSFLFGWRDILRDEGWHRI
jgi:hypothetical protein